MEHMSFPIDEHGVPILGEWWPHNGIFDVVRPWARKAIFDRFDAIESWAQAVMAWVRVNLEKLRGLSVDAFIDALTAAAKLDKALLRPHALALGDDAAYPIARGRVWSFPPEGGASLQATRPDTHVRNSEIFDASPNRSVVEYLAGDGVRLNIEHLMPLVTVIAPPLLSLTFKSSQAPAAPLPMRWVLRPSSTRSVAGLLAAIGISTGNYVLWDGR